MGVGGTLNGYVNVISDVKPSTSPSGAKAGILQSIPAGIQPPTIKDFKVINGMVYLFLENMSPAVSYDVAAGQAPGSLAPVPQTPVLGGGSETIIVTPATGASGFFTPVVQTAFSTWDIWIIISIAAASIVAFFVIMIVKKKKV